MREVTQKKHAHDSSLDYFVCCYLDNNGITQICDLLGVGSGGRVPGDGGERLNSQCLTFYDLLQHTDPNRDIQLPLGTRHKMTSFPFPRRRSKPSNSEKHKASLIAAQNKKCNHQFDAGSPLGTWTRSLRTSSTGLFLWCWGSTPSCFWNLAPT